MSSNRKELQSKTARTSRSATVTKGDQFPYPDNAKIAGNFLLGFFKRVRDNKEILRMWLDLKATVRIEVTPPGAFIIIDAKSANDFRVSQGRVNVIPDVTMRLSAFTFHELYSGRLSIFQAFGSESIKTEGDRSIVTKMTRTWTWSRLI